MGMQQTNPAMVALMMAQAAAAMQACAPARPAPSMSGAQRAVYDAVAGGAQGYAAIGRKAGLTLRQARSVAQGMLLAGLLVSRGGVLEVVR